MMITLKLCDGLPSLCQRDELDVFLASLGRVNREHAIRLVHWVVVENHVHVLLEGDDTDAVSRAMRGLTTSLARNLNKLWDRCGKVFVDRYHRSDLDSPTRVRNALRYVFMNHAKHTGRTPMATAHHDDGCVERVPYVDHRYSSALYSDGWREEYVEVRAPDDQSVCPRSWLLRVGFQKAGGLLSVAGPIPRSS